MFSYEQRLEMVTLAAWERWTKNGLNMDSDEREQTMKSARDAATNCYVADITEDAWQAATLHRLGAAPLLWIEPPRAVGTP
jgi:hypothetical protein